MSILYRPIIKSKGDKYKIEKYSGKLEKDLFEQNITVEEMVGFANFFFEFKRRVPELYQEIYGGGGYSSQLEESFGQKWGWYGFFYRLCQGKVWKLNKILKLPHGQALMWLCYEADKFNVEQQKLKLK